MSEIGIRRGLCSESEMITAEVPVISGLRADLVPHRFWAVSRWFYANPIWYYHRASAAHELCVNGRFYQLVDPELREVCRLLHGAGLRTTPSCQGHCYPKERFERIWNELKREEPLIRGDGLIVRDCENDRAYMFREAGYRVPWMSFDAFYDQAGAHQTAGYLGIVVPTELAGIERELRQSPYRTTWSKLAAEKELGARLGGTVFGVRVAAPDEPTRAAEWRRFTSYIEGLLESRPSGGTRPVADCQHMGDGSAAAWRGA